MIHRIPASKFKLIQPQIAIPVYQNILRLEAHLATVSLALLLHVKFVINWFNRMC